MGQVGPKCKGHHQPTGRFQKLTSKKKKNMGIYLFIFFFLGGWEGIIFLGFFKKKKKKTSNKPHFFFFFCCESSMICNQKDTTSAPMQYNYHTTHSAVVHPTSSSCCGQKNGFMCGSYASFGGSHLETIDDPVLHQRAGFSAGCSSHRFNRPQEKDSFSDPPPVPDVHSSFRGPYSTRSFLANTVAMNENSDFSKRFFQVPTTWTEGYHGYNCVDGNIQGRMMSSMQSAQKYKSLEYSGPSAQSYGSYGVQF